MSHRPLFTSPSSFIYPLSSSSRAIGLLLESPSHNNAESRRAEYKASAISSLHGLAEGLAGAAGDPMSGEIRRAAILTIKEVCTKLILDDDCD